MLRVLFFARVREQLGCASLQWPWDASLDSLAALEAQMIARHGEPWPTVLAEDNLVRAINHRVVAKDALLADGDEIAFYPPVTGG